MSIYACMMLIYVAVTAAIELLALWAAADRRALLQRALVLWGAILLLLPIRAFDAALLLTISSGMTVGIVSAIGRLWPQTGAEEPSRPRRWRFSLADIVVLTLFFATFFALARETLAARSWTHAVRGTFMFVVPAMAITAVAISAHYAAAGPWRRTMGLVTVLAAFISAAHFYVSRFPLRFWERSFAFGLYEKSEGIWLLITFYLLLCVALSGVLTVRLLRDSPATPHSPGRRVKGQVARILVLALAIPLGCLLWELAWGRLASAGTLQEVTFDAIPLLLLGAAVCVTRSVCRPAWQPSTATSRRLRVGFAIALSVLVAMPATWLYWQMLRPTPFPLVTYEEPNHYDRIMAIAEQIGDPPATAARHPLLDEAVVLLQSPNHIPLEVVEASMRAPRSGPPLVYRQLWPVTERLRQAAESAANAGQPDRGANYAIAILRLSNMLQRGGRSDEAAEGQRLNWSGFRFLAAHRGSFSPAKARETIAALQRLLDERDDPATLAARDFVHTARTRGWREKLRSTLALLRGKHRPNAPQFDDQRRRDEAVNLLLQADLAIRLYREDTGNLPASLAELVPAYLAAVPLDPYDGQPLRYQVEGDRFLLHSVVRNRFDQYGRPATNPQSDIDLDTVAR